MGRYRSAQAVCIGRAPKEHNRPVCTVAPPIPTSPTATAALVEETLMRTMPTVKALRERRDATLARLTRRDATLQEKAAPLSKAKGCGQGRAGKRSLYKPSPLALAPSADFNVLAHRPAPPGALPYLARQETYAAGRAGRRLACDMAVRRWTSPAGDRGTSGRRT